MKKTLLVGLPPNFTVIQDPSEIATGVKDPFEGSDRVHISYGGSDDPQQPEEDKDTFAAGEEPPYRKVIQDTSEIATGVEDPFEGSDRVHISYGG